MRTNRNAVFSKRVGVAYLRKVVAKHRAARIKHQGDE